ncbi:Glycosyl transferases group 1 [Filimonas lacunae]|uniref:Glycosyl transferases group 1 n=1 Tax=Filimonas lacunae TaxID=477680 RepID=A0A173MDI7_9BACT|nr:glycosyltransferase family 4 protein [Filimonas lacunae]BAV05566.1 alpha-1,4-N-acetylgalactosamine transferase PglH [Filimonas lacunae]SIT29347.1 Glycosyl transferases group 1 [Filimonas lacunae]
MYNGKTIVILSPAFPANEADSVWVPSKQLFVKMLQRQNPQSRIIVLAFNYPHHTHTYQWHGATVIPFAMMPHSKLQRWRRWAKVWFTLQQLHRQHTIAGIISFWCGECALIGSYFGKWKHIPHRCWVSGQDARAGNYLVKWIRPQPEELVPISDFLVDEFEKHHAIRPRYMVPIGIDPEAFPSMPAKRDIDILGAGSLIPLKRYDLFIHLIKNLSCTFPHIKAVICGGGAEYDALQQLIQSLQLQQHITLLGEQSHATVLQLMHRSKILLHTSSYEGFGNVLLESLYAGCRVASFVQPVYQKVTNWHIATDETHMQDILHQLLQQTPAIYERVLVYRMEDNVKAFMRLLLQQPPAPVPPPAPVQEYNG